MRPPNLTQGSTLDIKGMQLPQISTLLTGASGGFREVAGKFGITPFDPQSLIDSTGILTQVEEFQKQIGVIGTEAIGKFSKLNTVPKNVGVVLDWLN